MMRMPGDFNLKDADDAFDNNGDVPLILQSRLIMMMMSGDFNFKDADDVFDTDDDTAIISFKTATG